MDPLIQGSMIFAIIMTVILGGFIVTFPVMRRLGRVMEESLRDRQRARLGDGDRARLEGEITELQRTAGTASRRRELEGRRVLGPRAQPAAVAFRFASGCTGDVSHSYSCSSTHR
jgi:hypothetical protein